MAYTPTNWQAGETATVARMNKIEAGIQDAEVQADIVKASGLSVVNGRLCITYAEEE